MSAIYQTPLEWELGTYCHDLLEPAPDLQVYQWAEENIYLSERSSALPGRFSTVLTPYIREPLQGYADRAVTDLVLCFGTQTAKTTVIMVGTAYRIVNDPAPVLWVMPIRELAKSFSKTRWKPMVDDCPPLAAQKPDDRHLFGTEEQHFDKVTLNFVGSNSPAQLASRPAGVLNLDETDKFKTAGDREAGALQLAEERTKTFAYPLRAKTSTPTTVHGDIWREFKLGDQRYFHVPCPHCSGLVDKPLPGVGYHTWESLNGEERAIVRDTWITFKFKAEVEGIGDCGLRWYRESEDESKTNGAWDMEKVRANTFYKCQRCGGAIFDRDKSDMLLRGIWVPTNPNAEPGRRSYHLNTLYSMLGRECRWGSIAIKWLQTKGSITKRQNFINSTLAEPWDEERGVDDVPVFKENYNLQIICRDDANTLSVLASDVQQNHLWPVVRRFTRPTRERPMGESWLAFADKVMGGKEEIMELQEKYNVADENVMLDVAHFTSMVCRWIVERNWRGAWGSDKNGFLHTIEATGQRVIRPWSTVQYRDALLGADMETRQKYAHLVGRNAAFIFWSNDIIKDNLAVLRYTEPAIFHVHTDVTTEYQKHLSAEIKTTKKSHRTGKITQFWKQIKTANHLNDSECMAVLRAMRAGFVPMPEDQPAAVQRLLELP